MDSEEFRKFGKAMVDYIADYWDNIRERPVVPSVEPGYLLDLLPNEPPTHPEDWRDIMSDIEKYIMPGMTHWISPKFHGYFPSGNSFPSMVGELLSAGLGCIGFNWMVSPACTELEVVTLNWLGKMLDLPEAFLNCSKGPGGGVIQGSASESTFITLIAAKRKTINNYKRLFGDTDDADISKRLVAYTSDQANSSVEKAGMLGCVFMRLLTTKKGSLKSKTLQDAITKDRNDGLIPFYVAATFGTTATCAFDDVAEIGEICNCNDMWLHIDAAYAGAALVCPEFRHLMKGIEMSHSFSFSPHKWMLTNFDLSVMWVTDSAPITDALSVDRLYLQHQFEGEHNIPDFRHWQIPLGRRFRALKLWFVLRIYGVEGVQEHVRKFVRLAEYFEKLVHRDDRFEVCSSSLGLVCFRLKGGDSITQTLLDSLIASKKVFATPATYEGKYVIRFSVCSILSDKSDIDTSWNEIVRITDLIVPTDDVLVSHISNGYGTNIY